ncbi:MAG: hypothetical protein U0641_19060 [Anaerolineae bacterium]
MSDRFGYDPAGNMTTRGGQSLVYDAEGRLTSVSGATGTETYAYDGDGAIRRRTTAAPTYVPPYAEDFLAANSGWSTSGTVAWGVNPNDGTSHTTTFRASGASS